MIFRAHTRRTAKKVLKSRTMFEHDIFFEFDIANYAEKLSRRFDSEDNDLFSYKIKEKSKKGE
jgi:hypothetical protein